jgi:glycosyltransferase involved in cell wall biosynthesis
MPAVRLYSPMPLDSGKGNAVSALRIAALLREAGVDAAAVDQAPVEAGVLVVLNAWRSAPVALEFRRRCPQGKLIALLTGTDVFPAFPSHPEVIPALHAADAIVAWHSESAAQLPPDLRRKARVIFKSSPDAPADLPPREWPAHGPLRVLVAGHLREVKDPFRAAAALLLLPPDSRITVIHAGGALSEDMESAARDWQQRSPRWQWAGSIPRTALWEEMKRAFLTVNSSWAEGGANAVIESLVCGVPVLASRIPGNTGLLGRDWPGLFTAGDAAELAALLHRCESEPAFYGGLLHATREAASRFPPGTERDGWLALLADLGAGV